MVPLAYDQRTDFEESNEVPCHTISASAAGSFCWIDSSKINYFYAVLSSILFLDTNLLNLKNFQVFSELMTTHMPTFTDTIESKDICLVGGSHDWRGVSEARS